MPFRAGGIGACGGRAMNPADANSGSPAVMHTTCWTVVLAAGGGGEAAGDALELLCRRYWQPVFGFFIRCGLDRAAAEDETQEFFACLLRRDGLSTVDPEKGRFRAFLLACLKFHMTSVLRHGSRQKRGGGQAVLSLDAALADGIALAAVDAPEPEAAYDRQWAENVMHQTSERLRMEYDAAGRGARFTVLRDYLMWDSGEASGAALAEQLRESETAVRSAIFRMRRRFGLLLREEIAGTLGPGEDVEEELRYLARVMAR